MNLKTIIKSELLFESLEDRLKSAYRKWCKKMKLKDQDILNDIENADGFPEELEQYNGDFLDYNSEAYQEATELYDKGDYEGIHNLIADNLCRDVWIDREFKDWASYRNLTKSSDIFQYKSEGELRKELRDAKEKSFTKKLKKASAGEDFDKIWENDDMLIVVPKSHVGACKFGQGTKWCTASKTNNYFDSYYKKGILYRVLQKNDNYKELLSNLDKLDKRDIENLSKVSINLRRKENSMSMVDKVDYAYGDKVTSEFLNSLPSEAYKAIKNYQSLNEQNLKKIIREEVEDFDWVRDIKPTNPIDDFLMKKFEEKMVGYLSMDGREGDIISREWATVEAFLIELKKLKENLFVNFLSRILLQSHVERPYPYVLEAIEKHGFDVNKSEETKRLYKKFQSYNSLGNRIKRTLKNTLQLGGKKNLGEGELDWIGSVSNDYWDYYDAVVFNRKLSKDEFNDFINQALKSVQPFNASDWEDDDEMSDLEYLNYRIRREGQAFIGKYVEDNGKTVLVYGTDPYELYPQVKDPKVINYEDIKKGLFESNDFDWLSGYEFDVDKVKVGDKFKTVGGDAWFEVDEIKWNETIPELSMVHIKNPDDGWENQFYIKDIIKGLNTGRLDYDPNVLEKIENKEIKESDDLDWVRDTTTIEVGKCFIVYNYDGSIDAIVTIKEMEQREWEDNIYRKGGKFDPDNITIHLVGVTQKDKGRVGSNFRIIYNDLVKYINDGVLAPTNCE